MISRLLMMFRRRMTHSECGEVRDLSSDYIDDELDQTAADKVTRHLSWFGPCNAFVNTLRSTVRLLRTTPKQEAPSGFRERVRERIRTDSNG